MLVVAKNNANANGSRTIPRSDFQIQLSENQVINDKSTVEHPSRILEYHQYVHRFYSGSHQINTNT